MADNLTQQITEALTKAAAESTGLPLYAGSPIPGSSFQLLTENRRPRSVLPMATSGLSAPKRAAKAPGNCTD